MQLWSMAIRSKQCFNNSYDIPDVQRACKELSMHHEVTPCLWVWLPPLQVYKGRRRCTGQITAMKFIVKHGKSEKDIRNLRQEIEILRQLRHENIIQMLDAFETKTDFCVVTGTWYWPRQLSTSMVQSRHEAVYVILEMLSMVLSTLPMYAVLLLCQDAVAPPLPSYSRNFAVLSKYPTHHVKMSMVRMGFVMQSLPRASCLRFWRMTRHCQRRLCKALPSSLYEPCITCTLTASFIGT